MNRMEFVTWTRCKINKINKRRVWDLASKCAEEGGRGQEIGFDLSTREGRSFLPHHHYYDSPCPLLCSASVDMDLTGLIVAVKQGPATAAR